MKGEFKVYDGDGNYVGALEDLLNSANSTFIDELNKKREAIRAAKRSINEAEERCCIYHRSISDCLDCYNRYYCKIGF